MAPIELPVNRPGESIFAGGARISELRSAPRTSDCQGEDWIASTTCCFGTDAIGFSRLPDGPILREAVTSEPAIWLGPQHNAKYGHDTKLLVKLLDASHRLPVHAHPHVDWARKHLGRSHGKAEAWYILTLGSVWLGLTEDIDERELLGLLHQTLYVPPGTLHAIGEGVMVVEVQEPEDLSILCEWVGHNVDGKKDGHLGLGFPVALTGVNNRGWTREQVERCWVKNESDHAESVFANDSREYFRMERLAVKGRVTTQRDFAVLIVLEGKMSLRTEKSESISIGKGSTVVIPYEDGDMHLDGEGEFIKVWKPCIMS
ncbi:hypothetical protein E4U59_001943 [Claviceps monticola]|nr:hypothetical protein E4U59_001943 [Claviceps monticola]